MPLSTKPYKGARDFYPEDKRVQNYMFNKWRETAERFGYQEYDAAILEPLELYTAKSGDEIVNEQTYLFEDRGGRQVVIRPEMTPTVSRMVAARRQELPYPLRWYSIPNFWRYERPQRGRLREFWQLNVDIFGVAGPEAETELVTLIDAMFKNFGATSDMYEIRINNRELMNYLFTDYLGLDESQSKAVSKLIDRIHKMERTAFIEKVDAALSAEQRSTGITEKLLALLDAKKLTDLPQQAQDHQSAKDLASMLGQLQVTGVASAQFDITIMRGLDYYTGIVFEVFDTDPENNRAMLGGGRYDGLVALFGVAPVPTVGFGWGDVTLQNFLESHRLMPKLAPSTDVYVVLVGDVAAAVQATVTQLRAAGLKVAVDLSGKKIGDQFKNADKQGIATVLIVGESELQSGIFKLKNLKTGDEVQGSTDELIAQLAG